MQPPETQAEERAAIDAAVLDWMREADPIEGASAQAARGGDARGEDAAAGDAAERFESLALRLFVFQYRSCPAYARFCDGRGASPDRVRSWREIPAVPTGAFKELPLRCFPARSTRKTFLTSGTSTARRGALHLDRLELYEVSLLASLRRLLFPELGRGERMDMRVLAPSPVAAPESSLSHMFGCLLEAHGSDASGFDVEDGALCVDRLVDALGSSAESGRPLALCGTAFAFVHLLDALQARGLRFALPGAPRRGSHPGGSRIMGTGGFKGRSRELSRDELVQTLSDRLGVTASQCVDQYGMTELGSQFYDSTWIDPDGPRRKLGPPWARVRIVDPESGSDIEGEGAVGLIVIHDLANTGSIAAVQTADLGRRVADGFEVLGRATGAEDRGCSIAADAMLAAEP